MGGSVAVLGNNAQGSLRRESGIVLCFDTSASSAGSLFRATRFVESCRRQVLTLGVCASVLAFGERKAGIASYHQEFGDPHVHSLISTTMIIKED